MRAGAENARPGRGERAQSADAEELRGAVRDALNNDFMSPDEANVLKNRIRELEEKLKAATATVAAQEQKLDTYLEVSKRYEVSTRLLQTRSAEATKYRRIVRKLTKARVSSSLSYSRFVDEDGPF